MGDRRYAIGVCYECGGQLAITDSNTNYEPIIQMVQGKVQTLNRHKDCSKGDNIVKQERPKAQVIVGGDEGKLLPEPKMTQDEEDDFDLLNDLEIPLPWEKDDEESEEEPMTPLEEAMKVKKDTEYQNDLERVKNMIENMRKFNREDIKFHPQVPKPELGSITLSLAEREALAAALYRADVVEITGEKLVGPRRFDAEMKKVLYKVIKGL